MAVHQTWPNEFSRCTVQDSLVLMDRITTFLTYSLRRFPCQKMIF
jgi:hypothetical protein